ncbi:MAG: BamA/TamA family outer membrane protein, partial [Flavitalea sp.]
KQSVNIDFETSRNVTDALTTGSLFGIGLNLGLRNRNAFSESIQSSSNLRFGVELGPNIVQTAQASFSHNIAVPRFILPFRNNFEKNWTAPKTLINFNTAYTDRRKYVQVRSVNTSWGYSASKKNHTWQYIPFNIEYTSVNKSDSFRRDEVNFPTLALAFNTGLIISQIISYTTGKVSGRNEKIFRASFEESGAIFGMIKNLERGDLNRFLKLDLEYRRLIKNPKSAWAFRAFGGYGFVYGKMGNEKETNLPFFKAYFGGGPYSMRAWQVRQLGLGSSKVFEDTARRSPDRFGDMKLEGNVEYRFNLATIAGIKVKSAFFVDMGNVWGKAVDKNMNKLDSTEFNLGRLYKDLAVGGGTSLRFDFDFFLIRLDWAYKLKDPIYADDRSGWLHNLKLSDGQFQLGIGYPF